jgi:5'(3')-deoxyribonucleotidase
VSDTQPAPHAKKILYLDMDGVLVDFNSGIAKLDAATREKFKGKPENVPGIFLLMDPMPGAQEAYGELCKLFDTYLLSAPPWDNPTSWADKRIWVEQYLGESVKKRLILTHRKDLAIGDFLVDDRMKCGAPEFKGERIHFGVEPYMDWKKVLEYMRNKT